MKNIQEMLDENFVTLEEKFNVMIDFISAYPPWSILFEEHITNYKTRNSQSTEKVM